MKKIISVVIALAMICSLGMMAFADTTYTITINNPDADYTYYAYQIFKGDLNTTGDTLSNIAWGDDIADAEALLTALKTDGNPFEDAFAACETAEDVANILAEKDDDSEFLDEFAKVVATKVATNSGKVSERGTNVYTIDELAAGYYIVTNTAIPTDTTDVAYSSHILELVNNVIVTPKSDKPTVDKEIIDPEDTEVKDNEASIGETVSYQITSNVPVMKGYDTYYFAFHDTLSSGLDYVGSLALTIGGVEVPLVDSASADATTANAVYTVADDADGSTKIDVVIKDLKGYTEGAAMVLTYDAKLNTDAVIVEDGNPNTVYVEYSNNPNTDGKGFTTDSTVVTYTTSVEITKKDGENKILTGAEFHLTGTAVNVVVTTTNSYEAAPADAPAAGEYYWKLLDGTYTAVDPSTLEDTSNYVNTEAKLVKTATVENLGQVDTPVDVKAFVGEDGKLLFEGLGAGTYTLTETTTPDGYNTIDPIVFTISYTSEGVFSIDNEDFDETDNKFAIDVINRSGTVLPSTGGIGTTIFYTLGGILLIGAAVLLVAKKKMAYVA